MTDIRGYLEKVAKATDTTLEQLLVKDSVQPKSIHSIMRYSVFAGGKRIRPALIMAAAEACGMPFGNTTTLKVCAAYEMFHTFSLMHDDLPCMDDDDFRRGKPTAHKAFTEALAVLGGDALCIQAFEILADIGNIEIIREIARALGTQGMIGGQVVDIESEGKTVDLETVTYIHEKKTSALIQSCVRAGGLIANAPTEILRGLSDYGYKIGLAFQIIDDILDEVGTTEQLGKDAGSDKERGKATYPALIGMDNSRNQAKTLIESAWEDIAPLGDKGQILRDIAEFIRIRIS